MSKDLKQEILDALDSIRAKYTCDFDWEAIENSVYKIEKILANSDVVAIPARREEGKCVDGIHGCFPDGKYDYSTGDCLYYLEHYRHGCHFWNKQE